MNQNLSERAQKIVDFLDKEILKMIKDFSVGSASVTYAQICNMPSYWIEIEEGVFARRSKKTNSECFVIECKMNAGAILKIHNHPDYKELFKVITGVIFDKVSKITLGLNQKHTFNETIYHWIECIEDCFIEIYCTPITPQV